MTVTTAWPSDFEPLYRTSEEYIDLAGKGCLEVLQRHVPGSGMLRHVWFHARRFYRLLKKTLANCEA